jgi:flagellar biosynthesis/type III secretory pathway ATPase
MQLTQSEYKTHCKIIKDFLKVVNSVNNNKYLVSVGEYEKAYKSRDIIYNYDTPKIKLEQLEKLKNYDLNIQIHYLKVLFFLSIHKALFFEKYSKLEMP